jgi:hypothetical protein
MVYNIQHKHNIVFFQFDVAIPILPISAMVDDFKNFLLNTTIANPLSTMKETPPPTTPPPPPTMRELQDESSEESAEESSEEEESGPNEDEILMLYDLYEPSLNVITVDASLE